MLDDTQRALKKSLLIGAISLACALCTSVVLFVLLQDILKENSAGMDNMTQKEQNG